MPSESTYTDRYGRAETLNTAIGGFKPAFAPANAEISSEKFTPFLAEVKAANDAVTGARDNYTDAVERRNDLVKDSKDRAGRVLAQLKTNPAWSQNLTAIKRHYDKMRGDKQAEGAMPIAEVLRHKIRYFSDGVVLGSADFVNRAFERERHRFGPKRKDGARKMRGADFGSLRVLRDLRVRAFG